VGPAVPGGGGGVVNGGGVDLTTTVYQEMEKYEWRMAGAQAYPNLFEDNKGTSSFGWSVVDRFVRIDLAHSFGWDPLEGMVP
jgi:hypothetical protein